MTESNGGVGRSDAVSEPVIMHDCFGWLHRPTGVTRDVAVLLCPAIGWDGLHSYHGFRVLADQLAACGYPTLRFQYPGTGDSGDVLPGRSKLEHWTDWQASVHAMADGLRAATGVRRLVLIGLRLGATLAATVAQQRDDVDGLALLAPVLRGKSYMRQLDMEARLEGGGAAQGVADGLEFHELHFSLATVAAIGAVDLRHCALRPGLSVAVYPQAPSSLVDGCVQAWATAGVRVECGAFEGLAPLMQEAIHSDPAPPDFTQVIDWVTARIPARQGKAAMRLVAPACPALALEHCAETPIRFGAGDRLFGILCRPTGPQAGTRAVVIGNTGRDPHYGIARFGVELARRLAAEGIASLRMDFTGLGDTAVQSGPDGQLSALFDTDRSADTAAAIAALGHLGFHDIALQGVCSGAYHALRVGQVDERVRTLLMVNLPVFEWQGGDTVQAAMWKSTPPSRLLSRLVDPAVWKRALSGNVQIVRILQAQGMRLVDRVRGRVGRRAVQATPALAMAALASRGVEALFLYSAGDPGVDALQMAFGPEGEALRGFAGVDLRIVPGIDHVLSGRLMREKAIHHIVNFLRAQTASRATGTRSPCNDRPLDHPGSDHASRPPAAPDARAAA